jgi:hypothetical protein
MWRTALDVNTGRKQILGSRVRLHVQRKDAKSQTWKGNECSGTEYAVVCCSLSSKKIINKV